MSISETSSAGWKCQSVIAALRSRIVSGSLQPGEKLPRLELLEQDLRIGRPTLLRALDRLRRDGFIYSDQSRARFVSPQPPHLSRYALVFAAAPQEERWNRFWGALSEEATRLAQSGVKQVPVFYGVSGHPDVEGYQHLLHDLESQRLAGLVLVGTNELMELPLWGECPEVPKVAIFRGAPSPEIPRVYHERQSFIDQSLDWLASRGRKRVAVLINDTEPALAIESYQQGIAARGMTTRPFWMLTSNPLFPAGSRSVMQLLFSVPAGERPDGLVIADDHLVEHGLAGVAAAGAQVPEQLDVVAHCNWPWPVPCLLPARRLGFDSRQILAACLGTLERLRKGEPVPQRQLIPAVFEDQISRVDAQMVL